MQLYEIDDLNEKVNIQNTELNGCKSLLKVRNREILSLKDQIQMMIEDNQNLNEEKMRIMCVNQILEQKIHVERSDVMSLQNDVDQLVNMSSSDIDGRSMRRLG